MPEPDLHITVSLGYVPDANDRISEAGRHLATYIDEGNDARVRRITITPPEEEVDVRIEFIDSPGFTDDLLDEYESVFREGLDAAEQDILAVELATPADSASDVTELTDDELVDEIETLARHEEEDTLLDGQERRLRAVRSEMLKRMSVGGPHADYSGPEDGDA